jgi:hypothetical protein
MSESQQPGPMLTFHDTDTGPSYPSALAAQRAGTWAAERGQYRIAQQLLGLAAALEAHETDAQADDWRARIEESNRRSVGGLTVRVPKYNGPLRHEVPARPLLDAGQRYQDDPDATQVDVGGSASETVVTQEGHLIVVATGQCHDTCPAAH